ncbi:MAG: prepilin-type N-terminal cleavage/methylation domain-containing protein [Lachnospiraceae bacterium]|nr:prepilin-type N-terminal cleavage/methylation domain-containing protein [Lachnospiraceae bacterium]
MKKLREIKERRKNNKGFSLVELIIVIAIMAILVAILAPQFLKYVERSRNTADIANAREISNAIIAYIADTEVEDNIITTGGATVTVDKDKAVIGGSGSDTTTVLNALKEAGITAQTSDSLTLNDIKCKSKNNWTSYVISVKVDDKGVVTFTYTATGPNAENAKKFADAFQQGSGSSSGSGSGTASGN